ncbi:hypothetical protein [Scytonema sp. PCC 10023]|uniref:hypothetical protein n=1 Tax=Scytonema sp. PCC 10023 TaxID=1680591 RepID=UPI0039C61F62
MLNKRTKKAKKNFLPFNLRRRQFLKNMSLIAAGVVAAIADGLLHRHEQQATAMRSPTLTDKSRLKQTRDSIADIWASEPRMLNNGQLVSMKEL